MKGFRNIGIDGLAFAVPAGWNAMSLEQLKFLAQLLQVRRTSFEVCTMMLMHGIGGMIVGIPDTDRGTVTVRLQGRRFALTVDQVSALAETYSFLFDDVYVPEPHIVPSLTMNHFPAIRSGGRVLKGPADGMLDIPFDSYVWLQTYLSGVGADPDNMNLALGSLWHSTDGTEPDDGDVDVIRALPAWQRMVMFWFVGGCLSRMQRLFPRVFSGGGGTAGGNVLDQQLRLLDSLAQGDMTRKDQVRRGKLVDALYVIDESVRRMEEREREMAKWKNA